MKLPDPRLSHTFIPRFNEQTLHRTKEVASKLRIREQAIEAGRRNEPATDDPMRDACQLEIIANAQAFMQTVVRDARTAATAAINEARLHKPRKIKTKLLKAKIETLVVEAMNRNRDGLVLVHKELGKTLLDYRGFEMQHRLPPKSAVYHTDVLMSSSTLVVIFIAETVANLFFYAPMQDNGIAGGVLLSAMVSAANITLGFGLGFFGLRSAIHVRWLPKVFGIAVTAILGVAGFSLHLALSALREAIAYDPAAKVDFLRILKPPVEWFDFTTVQPFVLFSIGVATFAVAALKGRGGSFGLWSEYWGHSGYDRRYREAENAALDFLEDCEDELSAIYGAEREALHAAHKAESETIGAMRAIQADVQTFARMLRDSLKNEVGRLHGWLNGYFTANRSVRTTPEPKNFREIEDFSDWTDPDIDMAELERLIEQSEAIHDENAAIIAEFETETLKDQQALIDKLRREVGLTRIEAGQAIAADNAVTGHALRTRKAGGK